MYDRLKLSESITDYYQLVNEFQMDLIIDGFPGYSRNIT